MAPYTFFRQPCTVRQYTNLLYRHIISRSSYPLRSMLNDEQMMMIDETKWQFCPSLLRSTMPRFSLSWTCYRLGSALDFRKLFLKISERTGALCKSWKRFFWIYNNLEVLRFWSVRAELSFHNHTIIDHSYKSNLWFLTLWIRTTKYVVHYGHF